MKTMSSLRALRLSAARSLGLALLLASIATYGCGTAAGGADDNSGTPTVPDTGNLGDTAFGDTGGVGTDTAGGGQDDTVGEDGASGGEDAGGSSSGGADGSASADGGGSAAYEHLCNPCKENKECAADAFAGAACATHSAELGSYCAPTCADSDACGEGYECKELADVEGTKAKFCVPKDNKECACSEAAIKASASTTCSKSASIGGVDATCGGVRKCEASGLTACDAAVPQVEVCDGADNDCNGKDDDGNDCDDKNACTDDVCTGSGGCKSAPNTEKCDDGDACTADDSCSDGKCAGSAANCDDKNACTVDSCDKAKGGCKNEAGAGACEDGDACTSDDTCKDGACVAGELASCDDGNPCTKNSCAVDTGKCATQTEADGKSCDDANKCTTGEACAVGICSSATQVDCDDGNGCTLDSCEPKDGCTSSNDDSATCDDGNACTSSSACSGGVCKGSGSADCDDKNPCTTDSCDPSDGSCIHKASSGKCDDGNKCTANTACKAGKCEGDATACDDKNDCTTDSCDPQQGCAYTNNTEKCDDGNKCSVEDTCKDGKCAGTVKDSACNDENPCTKDSCDPTNGCQYANVDGADCDDGDVCSEKDSCKDGKCKAGVDVCQCTTVKDCKDDGNLCNGVPMCKDSKCQLDPKSVVKCDTSKDSDCLKTSCDPAEGQCKGVAAADGKDCDDGSKCTTESTCKKGACSASSTKTCNDSNPCTADSCNPDDGKCLHKQLPDCQTCKVDADCDNKDACVDSCVSNKCEFVDPKVCSTLPDLEATTVTVTVPKGGVAMHRSAVSVAYSILNKGKGPAGAFTYGLWLSIDGKPDAKDVMIWSGKSAGLKAGQKLAQSRTFFVDPKKFKAGKYKVLLVADSGKVVKEVTPLNNVKATDLAIVAAPDLVLSKLGADKSAYKPGAKASIAFSETNLGTATAAGHKLTFYLSKSASSVSKGAPLLTTLSRGELLAGKSASGAVSVVVPKVTSGTWYILGIADATNVVKEGAENNNRRSFKILISGDTPANLVATAVLIGKKTWGPGEKISVGYTVTNVGDKAAGAFSIGFYVHNTSKTFTGARWVHDVALKGLAAKGAKASGTATFTLPTWMGAKGTYFMWMYADRTGKIAESNEKDNRRYGPFVTSRSGVDLYVSSSKLVNTVYKTTDTMRLTAVRRNGGQTASPSSVDRIYLNTSTSLSGAKILATTTRSGISAGGSNTISINLKAPTGTKPGTYYVGYHIDYNNKVGEYSEANNLRWAKVTLIDPSARGNLRLTGFAVHDSKGAAKVNFVPGELFYVSKASRITNNTKVPVGVYRDAYIGSTNTTISYGDPVLKVLNRNGLQAGAQYSPATSVRLSTGLKKGPYYVALWTDRYGQVAETTESDNRQYAKINITKNGVDLYPTKFTASKTTFEAGASLALSYARKNGGETASGGFYDGYFLSTDTTVSSNDIVLRSSLRSSMQAGATGSGSITVTVPATTKPGLYYLIYENDHKKAVAEMSESNNRRYIKVNVQAKGDAPDLIATVGGISGVKPGQVVTVAVKASNIGKKAAGPFAVEVWSSTNTTITTGDIKLGTVAFKGLAAGASATLSAKVTIPTSYLKKTYYLATWADRANKVLEKNEANNIFARPYSVTVNGVDLSATSLLLPLVSGKPKVVYKAGEGFSATVSHRNIGQTSTIKGYNHSLYLSTNTVFSTSEVKVTGTYSTPLGAGGIRNAKLSFTIPSSTKPGVWYIGYKVDRSSAIAEYNESNNIKWVKVTIDPPAALPDLRISAFKPTKTSYKPGEKVDMAITTTNSGKAGASSFRVGLYTSSNSTITTSDLYRYGYAISSLAAGKSSSTTKYTYLPTNLKKGTWYIGAIADDLKKVTEASETNNARGAAITISVNGLDLQPTSIASSALKVQAGATLKISTKVRNNGGITSFSHYNAYYLSTNTTISKSDTYIGRTYNASQAAGATESFTQTVTIPATLKPGKYYLGTLVDYLNARQEYNEANNVLRYGSMIEVTAAAAKPDLRIIGLQTRSSSTATTLLTSMKPGQVVWAWTTERNYGAGSAGARRTGYYISTNSTISKSDQYIEYYTVSSTLAGGKSVLYKNALVVPTNLKKGTYYIGAIADYNSKIAETNELNNASAGVKITITADGVDYRPTALKSTKTLYKVGEAISITHSRRNYGQVTGGSAYDAVYLSKNSTYGSGDIYLGRALLGSQTAGSTRSGTISGKIPTTLTPGPYYLVVRVNYQNAVKETSTVNNYRAYLITVTSAAGTPNLRSTGLKVNDYTVNPGQIVTVTSTVQNNGNASTGTYVDGYYGSTSSSLFSLGSLRTTRTGLSIAAGKTVSYGRSVKIPTNLLKGSYYLKIFHDYQNKIKETSESVYDNRRAVKLTVNVNGMDLQAYHVQTQSSSSLSAPVVRTFKQGQTVYLEYRLRNNGGITVPSRADAFYLSTNTLLDKSDIKVRALTGPTVGAGATTGYAMTSFKLSSTLKPGTYYVGYKVDDANKYAEYNESNNVRWTLSFSVTAATGTPDFDITALSANDYTVDPGQLITFKGTVKNIGNGTSKTGWRVGFYDSANSTISTGDRYIANQYFSAALGAGKSVAISRSLVVPTYLRKGTYYMGAYADYNKTNAELSETNNGFGLKFTINKDGRDLSPTSFGLSKYAHKPGAKVGFTARVHNYGDINTTTFRDRIYLSTNSTWDSKDLVVYSSPLHSALAANSGSTKTGTLTISSLTKPGTYYLIYRTDYLNYNKEYSETNNYRSVKITVTSLTGTPDLDPTALSLTSKTIVPGVAVSFAVKVKNIGTATSPGRLDGFYVGTDTIPGDADDKYFSYSSRGTLGVDLTDSYTRSIVLPTSLRKGTHYVSLVSDYNKKIAEVSETNNRYHRSIYVTKNGIDLAPTVLKVNNLLNGQTINLRQGQTFRIDLSVRNNGEINSGSAYSRVYLSDDSIIKTSDVLLRSAYISGWTPGQTRTYASTSLRIPENAKIGTRYVGVIVDYNNTRKEYNEGNNIRWVKVNIIAGFIDLRTTSVTTTATSYAPGSSLSARIYYRNYGTLTAGAHRIGLYGSTNTTISTSDKLISTYSRSSLVPTTSHIYRSFSAKIPWGVKKGTYYIGGYIDDQFKVKESDEANNNDKYKAITITKSGPDLQVTAFSCSISTCAVKAGAYIGMKYSRRNNGELSTSVSSTSYRDGWYLSTNSTFGSTDKLLREYTRSATSAGQTINGTGSALIPAGTKPGTYYLIYYTDHKKQIDEYSETNNYRAVKITVQ